MHRRAFVKGLGVSLGTLSTSLAGSSIASEAKQRGSDRALDHARIMSPQRLEDTLLGSSYMGCGGGGGLQDARDLINKDLASGLSFRQLSVADLDDSDRVASPYALASLAPVSADMQQRLDRMTPPKEAPTVASFRLLEEYLGEPFTAVIVGEIGPLSMAEALSLAARIGVPSLDADTVGRATPEINQHSVRVAGHAITPAAGVSLFGDEIILKHVLDPSREEDVFRALSVVSREIGVTDAAISGAIAKEEHVLVQGSLSLAANIGAAVRIATDIGEDPIAAARVAGDGYELFEGEVESFDWKDEDGFLVGTLNVTGVDAYAGQSLLLDYKNEHLVARRNGKVIATCPDLITLVDRTTNEGIANPDFIEGQRVVALGFRSPALWRRPEGLAVFSPRYFGYDHDYIPIEQRLSAE